MKVSRVAIAALALLVGVAATSFARVYRPATEVMGPRHANVAAYYRYGVVPDAIVFDIWSVDDRASAAGVMGGFMSFAGKMKDREFRHVVLAYRGEARFILEGRDFARIGREVDWQNPVYLLRTFPELLRNPDGSRAFSQWSGGMIGVLGAQMDDVNRFTRAWYIDASLRRR